MSMFDRVSKEEQMAFLNDVLPKARANGINLSAADIISLYDKHYLPSHAENEYANGYNDGHYAFYEEGGDTKDVAQQDVISPAVVTANVSRGKYGQRIKHKDYSKKNDTDGDGEVSVSEAIRAANDRFERTRPIKAYKNATNNEDKDRLREQINLGSRLKNSLTSVVGPYSKPTRASNNLWINMLSANQNAATRNMYESMLSHEYPSQIINSYRIINNLQDTTDPDAFTYKGIRKSVKYDINNAKDFPAVAFFADRNAQREYADILGGLNYVDITDPANDYGVMRGIALNEDNRVVEHDFLPIYEYDPLDGFTTIDRNNVIVIDPNSTDEAVKQLHNALFEKFKDNKDGTGDMGNATYRFYLNPETNGLYYQKTDYNDYGLEVTPAYLLNKLSGNTIDVSNVDALNKGIRPFDFVDRTGYPIISRTKLISAQLGQDGPQWSLNDILQNDGLRKGLINAGYIDGDDNRLLINIDKWRKMEPRLTEEEVQEYNKKFFEKYPEAKRHDLGGQISAISSGVSQIGQSVSNLMQTRDTSGIEDAINEVGSTQFDESGYDNLLAGWDSVRRLRTNYRAKDVRGLTNAQKFGNVFAATNAGAGAGAQVGGWTGAAIGGTVGAAAGLFGLFKGNRAAREKARKLNEAATEANQNVINNFGYSTNKVAQQNYERAQANFVANGGSLLHRYEGGGDFFKNIGSFFSNNTSIGQAAQSMGSSGAASGGGSSPALAIFKQAAKVGTAQGAALAAYARPQRALNPFTGGVSRKAFRAPLESDADKFKRNVGLITGLVAPIFDTSGSSADVKIPDTSAQTNMSVSQAHGGYMVGKEYDLSPKTIARLKAEGYEIEYV